MFIDLAVWALALCAAVGVRRLYVFSPVSVPGVLAAALVVMVMHATIGRVAALYAPGRVRGTYDEVVRLVGTVVLSAVVLLAPAMTVPERWFVPGTVPVIAGVLALSGMLAVRVVLRAVQARHGAWLGSRAPALVIGDGDDAVELVEDLLRDDSRLWPAAVIGGSEGRRNGTVQGIRVLGTHERPSDVAGRTGARTVVIADPTADAAQMRRWTLDALGAGLSVLVLPTEFEAPGQVRSAAGLRPVALGDLVGRRSVVTDDEALRETFAGQSVLVTGAGGTMGRALTLAVLRHGASRVVLLDRDESAVNASMLDLAGRGLDGHAVPALADVQDADALGATFTEHRPDVVLHAAGMQNAALLERYPAEAWKSNVLGTRNVLQAAASVDVRLFVNLSDDAASNATTALPAGQLIAERLTAGFDERCHGRYLSVRLGQLVESPSSIIRVFDLQIRHGGPLTVPAGAQGFMRAAEAAALVLQAAVLSDGGESMILDAGEPVPMGDVARSMMALSGVTGLELTTGGDLAAAAVGRPSGVRSTWHDLISYVRVPTLAESAVSGALDPTAVSAASMRFLALREDSGDGSAGVQTDGPESVDWDAVEREWAADEAKRGPSDVFSATLLDVRRAAGEQGTATERLARAGLEAAGLADASGSESGEVEEAPEPIYLSKAVVGPLEEKWVLKALRSGYVAPLGPMVDEFERRVAERVGVEHALALSSGTAALHLLLLHVGAKPGTYVVLPTMTFAATANAIMYTGATPYFVDVQESDANIDVDLMVQAVDELQAAGKDVAAVVTVDLYGRCCNYTRIVPELEKRGVPLLEDAAEALGATHHGRAAGSFGLGAALSFNGNKIMTTSGGGMLLSDDENLIDRARYLSTQARMPVPWYEHQDIGYNYRMSNVLAGLGIAQLARLDEFIARRRQIRDMYADLAADMPGGRLLGRGPGLSDAEDNCWLTSLIWDVDSWGESVDNVAARMGADGIEARHLWKPLHLMSAYPTPDSTRCDTAVKLFRAGLNLPSSAGISDTEPERVVGCLRRDVPSELHRK